MTSWLRNFTKEKKKKTLRNYALVDKLQVGVGCVHLAPPHGGFSSGFPACSCPAVAFHRYSWSAGWSWAPCHSRMVTGRTESLCSSHSALSDYRGASATLHTSRLGPGKGWWSLLLQFSLSYWFCCWILPQSGENQAALPPQSTAGSPDGHFPRLYQQIIPFTASTSTDHKNYQDQCNFTDASGISPDL